VDIPNLVGHGHEPVLAVVESDEREERLEALQHGAVGRRVLVLGHLVGMPNLAKRRLSSSFQLCLPLSFAYVPMKKRLVF